MSLKANGGSVLTKFNFFKKSDNLNEENLIEGAANNEEYKKEKSSPNIKSKSSSIMSRDNDDERLVKADKRKQIESKEIIDANKLELNNRNAISNTEPNSGSITANKNRSDVSNNEGKVDERPNNQKGKEYQQIRTYLNNSNSNIKITITIQQNYFKKKLLLLLLLYL
jgi:hypothetical protein